MTKQIFQTKYINDEQFIDYLVSSLINQHSSGQSFFIDNILLFEKQHFNEKDFATYDSGEKKQATLRYRPGQIRIPSRNILEVYETSEFEKGKVPRGLVEIDTIIISPIQELTEEELRKDGYVSTEQAIKSMQKYYPDLTKDSVVSLYLFGETELR